MEKTSFDQISAAVEAFSDGAQITLRRGRELVAILTYRVTMPDIVRGQQLMVQALVECLKRFDDARATRAAMVPAAPAANGEVNA